MTVPRAVVAVHRRRLPAPIATASGTWTERDAALLRIDDGDGRSGYGEASPLPGYSPDALDPAGLLAAAEALLAGACGAREALARLDERRGALTPANVFALETALADLVAQAAGVPLWQLWRAVPSRPSPLELNALLTGDDPAVIVEQARALVARGYRTLKLKLGRAGAFERERTALAALRAALPRDVRLRADANGAFSVEEAPRRLAALAPFELEYVEQPVAAEHLASLRCDDVPLAADESLVRQRDAVLASGNVAVLVLKPMVLGGAAPCLALARTARARSVVTGLFDGPVAACACAHLAFALDPPPLACGIDAAMLGTRASGARVEPFTRAGLGADPPPEIAR